ncbi:hypothetical protein Tco_1315851 [Tanacetum coccineum]
MLKQETMFQKGECSIPGDDTDAIKEKQAKENCLHTLLEDISKEDVTNTCFSNGFQRAFSSLFGEEVEYFAPSQMDSVEKVVVEKGLYKRAHDSRDNSGKKSSQRNKCNSSRENLNVEDGKISKDASEIDNNVAGAS